MTSASSEFDAIASRAVEDGLKNIAIENRSAAIAVARGQAFGALRFLSFALGAHEAYTLVQGVADGIAQEIGETAVAAGRSFKIRGVR